MPRDRDIFEHRQLVEELRVLECLDNAGLGDLMRLAAVQLVSFPQQLAFGRKIHARNQIEQRRFAGPVGTEDADDVAFVQRKRHVGYGHQSAESLGQMTNLKQHAAALQERRRYRWASAGW